MLWAIAAYILQGIICASLSDGLSKRKGYIGARFATLGFFFGIFGLLYAVGLPLERDDDIERIRNPKNVSTE
jgi:hypothetical protein